MDQTQFDKVRNWLFLAVVVFAVVHLTYEHFNGGIVTHHLFMRADLPGLSNWWELLILPLLVWISASVIKKRIYSQSKGDSDARIGLRPVFNGFLGMLLVSTVQSIAFVTGYQSITMYLAGAVLLAALFLPLYRLEYILGHVIGSTFVFGPAIPFVGVLMFAPISLLSHKCIIPLLKRFRTPNATEG
ncbi:MAG: hypothetical protein ACFHVJ_16480 [Aestuariibacter sp.]